MKKIIEKIDAELWQAILSSPFSSIDYENLLQNDPARIREEEVHAGSTEEFLPLPEQLHVENIHIPASGRSAKIRLRIYRPKGKQNLPVLLYFHGGAFIYGTPEQYDFVFFRLALDMNMLIVSVDYRLAPENPFPAGMEDGYDALLWLSIHSSQIGGDKNNIIIGGSSAGATLAASVTHLARDKREVAIRHQYLLYPAMSHLSDTPSMNELSDAPLQTKTSAEWMWKHYLNGAILNPPEYAVPLAQNNFKDLPDATVVVCELDPLKDEARLYAQKLKEANVQVSLLEIEGAVHAFDFFACSLTDKFYERQLGIFDQILTQDK